MPCWQDCCAHHWQVFRYMLESHGSDRRLVGWSRAGTLLSRAVLAGQVRRLVGGAICGAPPLAPLPAVALAGPPQPGRLPVRHLQRRLCARLRLRLPLATHIGHEWLQACMPRAVGRSSCERSFTSLAGQCQEQGTGRYGNLLLNKSKRAFLQDATWGMSRQSPGKALHHP